MKTTVVGTIAHRMWDGNMRWKKTGWPASKTKTSMLFLEFKQDAVFHNILKISRWSTYTQNMLSEASINAQGTETNANMTQMLE